MVLVILIVQIILMAIIAVKDWDDDLGTLLCGCIAILIILSAVLAGLIINGRALSDKIEMYEKENQRIEAELNILVEQYMNYEAGIYGSLKSESSITLVSLYPELKADTLVRQQIDVYTSNNSKIKELKEKLINISNYKWWLYFGR